MAKQNINVGTVPGDGTGDGLRVGAVKINDNFTEIYSRITNGLVPSSTDNEGKFLTTDGETPSWVSLTIPEDISDLTDNSNLLRILPTQSNNSGKVLSTNGTSVSWVSVPSPLPVQSGNGGKYLTTTGSAVAWASVFPSQTSHANQFLTTNGSSASWASPFPSQTDNANKLLTTNGETTSWTATVTLEAITATTTYTPLVSSINETLTLYSAYGIDMQATGEAVSITSGASMFGPGADVTILAGNGGDSGVQSSVGGDLILSAGAAGFDEVGDPAGGGVYLSGGSSAGVGGSVYIKGGNYGEGGTVGEVYIQGFKFPKTDGTSGQVLVTNGSKVLSWASGGGGSGSYNQDLNTTDSVSFASITTGQLVSTSVGIPTIQSNTNINLTANNAVIVTQSPFRLASFTTTARNSLSASNGDMIYNTTTSKVQAYAAGSWIDLH